MLLTYGLLGLAIVALWLPSLRIRTASVPPWMVVFGAAIGCGLAFGYLGLVAALALALFAGVAYAAGSDTIGRGWHIVCGVLTGVLALALAMHKVPGFNNPQLVADIRFSVDALPYSQYANFDKGAVGLILTAFLCRRANTLTEWSALLRRALPIAAITLMAVLALSIAVGVVRPDFKLPAYTPIFLVTNLLFTCVAEEAFFRGFLQERMASSLPSGRAWQIGVIIISGTLFGVAHLGGGPVYAALAALCGFGYAYAYAFTRRVEAAILTHFVFNAAHFIGFTYPALQHG